MTHTPLPMALPGILAFVLTAAGTAQESPWTSHGPTGVGPVADVAVTDSAAYATTWGGVYRSDDGGVSWELASLEGQTVFRLVATSDPDVLLALVYFSEDGSTLYSSQDGGETWAEVAGVPPVIAAAVDPWSPATVYAGSAYEATIW